jgi:hypothetical protein
MVVQTLHVGSPGCPAARAGDVHIGPWLSTESGWLSTRRGRKPAQEAPELASSVRVGPASGATSQSPATPFGATGSVGVDQLADGGDLTAELVVDSGFAGDLVAGMENGRMVAPAQLGPDPEE